MSELRALTLSSLEQERAGQERSAGTLRAHGIEVEPDPLPNNPGYALLPSLTYQNRRTPRAKEQQVLIAEVLCLRVEGPFP